MLANKNAKCYNKKNKKFQTEWVAMCPSVKMIVTNKVLHVVKCTTCSCVEGIDNILMPKWDTM